MKNYLNIRVTFSSQQRYINKSNLTGLNATGDISILDEQIELCRQGNPKGHCAIYNRYAKSLLNSSMRILNNLADAEDIVQDAFVDAFRKLDSFTYNCPFEAWLKRIVINKSISFLRKKKVLWIDITSVAAPDKSDDDRVDEDLFSFEVQRVKKAISQLPENYRLVFNLYAIDGLPQEEIGVLLGIAHNNVRIQYHRARKKILETLQKEECYEKQS